MYIRMGDAFFVPALRRRRDVDRAGVLGFSRAFVNPRCIRGPFLLFVHFVYVYTGCRSRIAQPLLSSALNHRERRRRAVKIIRARIKSGLRQFGRSETYSTTLTEEKEIASRLGGRSDVN